MISACWAVSLTSLLLVFVVDWLVGCCFCFDIRSHYIVWPGTHCNRSGWPHRDPPPSVSLMLGLKACTTPSSFISFLNVFIIYVSVCLLYAHVHMVGGQRIVLYTQFSLSTFVWVPGIKLVARLVQQAPFFTVSSLKLLLPPCWWKWIFSLRN